MWTEAIILGLFGLISTLIFKGKELYETWIKFRESWREKDDAHESVTIKELRHIIEEHKKETSVLRSTVNFLSREQLRYIRVESDLWGYVQWLYDYAESVCRQLGDQGVKVDSPPPMPQREKFTPVNADAFEDRTRETQQRLETALQNTQPPNANAGGVP